MAKREVLGIDKYGKSWCVYRKHFEDTYFFYVVPEENRGKRWDGNYILIAVINLISKNRAIIEDFVHTNHKERSIKISNITDKSTDDGLYQKLATFEPALEVKIPDALPKDKKYPVSMSEAMEKLGAKNDKEPENWENRGIGKLLFYRVEKWAHYKWIRSLYGFMSKYDDFEKLKDMYTKWGWHVRMFSKSGPKIQCHAGYTVGIGIKKLKY